MKKKTIFIIAGVIALIVIIAGVIVAVTKQSPKSTEPEIKTYSQINLNEKQYVNSLEDISIAGTNDTFIITEDVKWEVPESEEGASVSFSIAIPYTIVVDGVKYEGTYTLGSGNSSSKGSDENPKYDFQVTNLTKNGEIQVLVK